MASRLGRRAALAAAVSLAVGGTAEAAFVDYVVVSTPITSGTGAGLVRHELFARFNGATDTVLNVFNFQAQGGWAAHTDAAAGFWHKDNSDYSGGVLGQAYGTWAPQLVGSATLNRPFDSFLLIGGNPLGTNSTSSDPSWNMAGANPSGWSVAQLPLANDLGWFNSSPPNNQGRVGVTPNTATDVKLGQFLLPANDAAFRTYTLRTAYNNGAGGSVLFVDGTFTLCNLRTFYRDLDGDGFGAAADGVLTQCAQPAGFVLNNTDNCPSIANPGQEDCNTNGVGDVCELASGSAADCNGNGRPDSCDIASGTAADCNSNGRPDSCDIATGPSTDLNTNGVPDECAGEFIVGGSGFATVQAAVTAAPSGATIRVGPGTRVGTIAITGKQLHLRSLAGATATVLSGSGISNAILVFSGAQAAGSTVTGFTFRDGRVGAILGSYRVGGAIAALYVPVTIDACRFENNNAGYGGAIYAITSASTVTNCVFVGNTATVDGGAIEFGLNGNGWSVRNSTFTNNASGNGGAVHVWATSGSFVDCGFTENAATTKGGGISWSSIAGTTLLVDGCVLERNVATSGGGLAVLEGPGAIDMLDTRLCRNAPDNFAGAIDNLGGNTFSQDCNGNNVCDADEIAGGTQQDCNTNGLPDACELDGRIVAWGDDALGQASPPPGIGQPLQIAAGCSHSLALKANGTVAAWGFNAFGQTSVPAGLTNVTQIAAGCDHNIALLSTGFVVCWGYNGFDQCVPPSTLQSVTQVSAGGNHTAARRANGVIVVWGRNINGESTVPASLSAAAEVACGGTHTVARRADGSVVCWGLNNFGQTNVPANVGTLQAIAAGCYHTAGLRVDGTVVCWGSNTFGETTVPANLTGVVKLSAGVGQHTIALKSDGTARSWGWNNAGQTNVPSTEGLFAAIAAGGAHTLARTRNAVDCNSNNIIDSCELAAGTAADCNGNGLLDSCEIASGSTADCNSNGRPDACDIATGPSTDLNINGIPDECSGEFIVGGSGFATVQAAVNAAPSGTTIRVAAGTRVGAIAVSNKQVHLRSISGAAATVLSGSGISSSILAFSGAQAAGSTVTGFTFRDGRIGAVLGTYRVGGAIAALYVPITIDACRFENNNSGYGGAVYAITSASTVTNCVFTGNTASVDGGAIEFGLNGNGWSVRNSLFTDNASGNGGAVHVWSTSGSFVDCEFINNIAAMKGGGISWNSTAGATVLVDGCVLDRNVATSGGGLAVLAGPGAFDVIDTRLCVNTPDNYSGLIDDLGGNLFGEDCNGNGVCDLDDIAAGAADTNSNEVLDSCERARGDLNLDGIVSAPDISLLLLAWGSVNSPIGDLNGDGYVNAADLSTLLYNWGTTP